MRSMTFAMKVLETFDRDHQYKCPGLKEGGHG